MAKRYRGRAPTLGALLALISLGAGCCLDPECFKVKIVRAYPPSERAKEVAAKPDRITLKEGRDIATWHSKSGELKVSFGEDSPFPPGQPTCHGNHCSAGPTRPNTARESPYKYEICIGAACKDPELMVKR